MLFIKAISGFSGRIIFFLGFVLTIAVSNPSSGQQQDQVKLMCYNILNYYSDAADSTTRNPYLRTVISSANPDILTVGEIQSHATFIAFFKNVMKGLSAGYDSALFKYVHTTDTRSGLFYKSSKFQFISNTPIVTELRDINEFKLKHILSGDTVRIYTVHLKASDTPADEAQRVREVDSLRKVTNALRTGSNFIVCGDFNYYRSTDSSYETLKQVTAGNEGYLIDPISMSGEWHNIAAYASRHTQSPRTRSFGGGITGGMDDRFDLIMYSKAINDAGGMTYVANSEIAYGNDGQHFNDSINSLTPVNSAVSQSIADALHYASDHLPVVASFKFEYGTTVTDMGVLSLVSPASPMCANAVKSLQVQVKNYSTNLVDFSSSNLQVVLQATSPSAVLKTFTKTISSGSLAAGATMNVTFDSTYNMSATGTYTINAYTVISGDAVSSNNAMTQVSVTVNANPIATITPAGPISLCPSASVTLTAGASTSYLWSTGATTQAISVSTAGSYTVQVTNAGGCSATSSAVVVSAASSPTATITPGGPISICPSSSVTLTSSVNSSYLWSTGATTSSINVSTAGNFTVQVTNSSGCTATSSPVVVSVATPSATITPAGPISICSASSTTLTANSSSSYLWSNGATTQSIVVSSAGNYSVTITNGGGCSATSSPVVVSVSSSPTATITPGGPISLCPSSSMTLSAGSSSIYLWSTGASTQSISVSNAGSYTVQVSNSSGCTAASSVVTVTTASQTTTNVFIETMGGVTNMSTTSISAYEAANSYDNDALTMTGSGDMRVTAPSTGYGTGLPTASGLGNVFLTNTSVGKNFIISGINTTGLVNLRLGFGVCKSTTASNSSDLSVRVSSDGVNYTRVSFDTLPTGTGTSNPSGSGPWYYRTIRITDTIPSVPNLRIQFRNDSTLTQFRIDDVKLYSPGSLPVITAGGSTTFCSGDSVMLTASSGSSYLWNTGATTQSIKAYTSGSYDVTENCLTSSAVVVTATNCSTVRLNLKVFISGFYTGGGTMVAVADPVGNPTLCDTIEVLLANDSSSVDPYQFAFSKRDEIDIYGNGHFDFPADVLNHRYYIVIRHRSSLETWTKYPVLFNSTSINFDFTSP